MGISSGAAEVHDTANATFDFLHLGYVIAELGLQFPKPFTLLIDNQAAEAFARNSAQRSKLKHIDCRQEWVQILRDKNIITPKHLPTEFNLLGYKCEYLTFCPNFILAKNRIRRFANEQCASREPISCETTPVA